jgi:hypothetical protein
MNLIVGYLKKIQEFGYEHPIQTRPKSSAGVTGEEPEQEVISGIRASSGTIVDLKKTKVGN